MVQLARTAGAERLIVFDPLENKRAIALKVGADCVLDPFDPKLQEEIHDAIGDGADVVIECVGKPQAIELAVSVAVAESYFLGCVLAKTSSRSGHKKFSTKN